MKIKEELFHNKSFTRIFNSNVHDITLNEIKFNFKRFLYTFLGLRKFKSNIYFIGFPDSKDYHFSKLFKFYNISSLKGDLWITGLFSNMKYIHKYIKIKRLNVILKKSNTNPIKDFYKILNIKILPDLVVLYERKGYTKYIIKECLKLRIPVIILFDINFQYDHNLIKIFNHSIKKEMFTKYFFSTLKILLKKDRIIERRNFIRRKKQLKYKKKHRNYYNNRSNNNRYRNFNNNSSNYRKKQYYKNWQEK